MIAHPIGGGYGDYTFGGYKPDYHDRWSSELGSDRYCAFQDGHGRGDGRSGDYAQVRGNGTGCGDTAGESLWLDTPTGRTRRS